MVESGAVIVVTLDADGQHLPSEMARLVQPVLDGEVDMAHGSRVLGHADSNHFARELGIVFFNRLVSLITRTHVTDCSTATAPSAPPCCRSWSCARSSSTLPSS